MANNHDQFIEFEKVITISESRKKLLLSQRKSLRDRISEYFQKNYPNEIQPRFWKQGSYAMQTLLNPIKDDDGLAVFDLDDGVYFIGAEEERLSVSTYHDRIVSAVTGHTQTSPQNKNTCVRVLYADGHHIDLPIYFQKEYSSPELAHLKKGWMISCPRELYEWFNNQQTHPQLRRIVKYLKAWADYVESQNQQINMPCGCILTILAVNNFSLNERDDVALKEVLNKMYNSLNSYFACRRPTQPYENMFEEYSDTRRDTFMRKLEGFKDDAERAINSKNPHEACKKWQLHFGDRFCCSSAPDKDEDAIAQDSAGPKLNNSRFA